MSDFTDPYLRSPAGPLHNLVGATTSQDLAKAEADLTGARLHQLEEAYPLSPTGDLEELRGIHRHLFQDVYPWAGELRTVDIAKGSSIFVPVALLRQAAHFAFAELRADGWLRGLPRQDFIHALAHHYDQINHLHPFREGNGRTQRVFWSRVASDAGWPLDWQRTTGQINDEASRRASSEGIEPLVPMLETVVATTPQPAQRRFRLVADTSYFAPEISEADPPV